MLCLVSPFCQGHYQAKVFLLVQHLLQFLTADRFHTSYLQLAVRIKHCVSAIVTCHDRHSAKWHPYDITTLYSITWIVISVSPLRSYGGRAYEGHPRCCLSNNLVLRDIKCAYCFTEHKFRFGSQWFALPR